MKVLFSLSVLCITLAMCQAFCYQKMPKAEVIDGVLMVEESCTDPYDGSRHPSNSKWNSHDCMECSCSSGGGMHCCSRYGGVAMAPPGCIAVVDPVECRYKFYRKDSPLEPCFRN